MDTTPEIDKLLMGLQGHLDEYKQTDSYSIYLFKDLTSVGIYEMKTIADSGLQCYLSVINGKIALFIFNN